MMSDSTIKFATIGSLIKKDLKEAYYLPAWPSTYTRENYRFLNDQKYLTFDCPAPSLTFHHHIFPFRHLPAVGDEVPILLDFQPPQYLKDHWKEWLTAFPAPTIRTIDQGLQDDIPIVTMAALQSIPATKHSVDPDVLYKVQLKSAIPEVGVPCPQHMEEEAVKFPCVVKVDQGRSSMGNYLAKDESNLSDILQDIREKYGWSDKILFQEEIQGIREVPSFQFYLHKSGEIYWVGTLSGEFTGYNWVSGVVDWNAQEYYKNLVWDEFTIPIATYLHKQGYFGLVTFELLITDHGMYLCDLNPRAAGETTHMFMAPFMAEMGYTHSRVFLSKNLDVPPDMLVKKANDINNTNAGRVIVSSVASVDGGCQCDVSIFSTTYEDLIVFYCELTRDYYT